MKNYKEFSKCFIGTSDVAALLLGGCDQEGHLISQYVSFGEDADYDAYIVEGEAEIGAHYSLVAEFHHWMNVYDDSSLVEEFRAAHIKVYRAGMRGCIIQLLEA